jgi:anti-anti-sigma factor
MDTTPTALRAELESAVVATLRRQLMTNRGTFAPARVAPVAAAIAAALLEGAGGHELGRDLGKEGLSLASLTHVQTAALEVIARSAPPGQVAQLVAAASVTLGALIAGQTQAHLDEIQRQRDEIERAFRKVLDEQREQEHRLRDAIRELSTPVIPIYEGILVLPLVGAIDSRRATEITEGLLEAIAQHQADVVILDITGVSVVDTSTANHLLMTTRAAGLLGSRVVLTGMSPEVAQSVVHLGVDLQGLVTFANLQAGLAFALGELGLAVQAAGPAKAPASEAGLWARLSHR